MHSLDGSHLKVRRAKSEIKRLASAEEAFRRDADYRAVKAEFNHQDGKQVYRIKIGAAPDPMWGIYAGEIAHNLRSALDGLVHQLVLHNCKTPTTNTQFPIFLVGHTTRKREGRNTLIPHFEGMELADGRHMIQFVSKPHQAMIERLQPYKRGQGRAIGLGKSNVLYLLKELNNADKHRLVQVIESRAGAFFTARWGNIDPSDVDSPGRFIVLEEGAKFLAAAPDVDVYPKITPYITFWKGCKAIEGKGVVWTLHRIAQHVEAIISDFRGALP
jgi:hypothetical protein